MLHRILDSYHYKKQGTPCRLQGVSLPRSGHHLLERILRKYFQTDRIYCDYYYCCQSVPCRKKKPFSKHHDLNLNLPVEEDVTYIVQFRMDPQSQFEAYFRFFEKQYRNGNVTFDVEKNFPYFQGFYNKYFEAYHLSLDEETRLSAYHQFVNDHLSYYLSFFQKWIHPHFFLVPYELFINSPQKYVVEIIHRLYPNHRINYPHLSQVIQSMNIQLKHSLRNSAYYNENFLEKYQLSSVNSYLQQLRNNNLL